MGACRGLRGRPGPTVGGLAHDGPFRAINRIVKRNLAFVNNCTKVEPRKRQQVQFVLQDEKACQADS